MKIFSAACLFITSMMPAYAVDMMITSYAQLVKLLETGNEIVAIIHLDRCQMSDSSLQAQLVPYLDGASTRFNFSHYLHYKAKISDQIKDTVVTAFSTTIEQPSQVLMSLNNKLALYDDNTAVLSVQYSETLTPSIKGRMEWSCNFSNGRDANGLVLYVLQ